MINLDDLANDLQDFAPTEKKQGRTALEERVIAGFEEIQNFINAHGRLPGHGENNDVFERLYAVRLDRLREKTEFHPLLSVLDTEGILTSNFQAEEPPSFDPNILAAELEEFDVASSITTLKHVRSSAEKRAAEDIANREPCEDFETFKPLFGQIQDDLKNGVRTTREFVKDTGFLKAEVKVGQFFILGGQTAYVAKIGAPIKAPNGEADARLRVIFSNGTESNLLLRSLQRALYKDDAGRRISEPSAGPLFAGKADEDDQASGSIYVLRSLSDHPTVAKNRELLHKIGVTGGSVENRIANAKHDATYLLADVEIVTIYDLFNINRTKLEKLIHRVFERARLNIELKDRFGIPVEPKEWFLVPLFVIDEVVEKIKDGTIAAYVYDPEKALLVDLDV